MSTIFYQRENRFFFWWSLWIYNDLYVIISYMYISLKFFNEKVGLNTILTSQFQNYLFPIFIIPKFLKFCNWFAIKPIEGSIVSKWNLSKIWIYFLVFLWKTASFLTWYFFVNFFYILYYVFTRGGFQTKTEPTKNDHCAIRGKEWRERGFKTKIKLTKRRPSPSRIGVLN